MSTILEWTSPGRRISPAWIFGTVSIGILLLYGISNNVESLIKNGAIALVIFQFIFVTRLLSDGYLAGIGGALFLHVVGSSRPEFAGGSTVYGYMEYWDVLTHSVTAFFLTIIVWSLIIRSTQNSTTNIVQLSDMYVFIWAVTLGIAMSVVWELIEYGLELYVDIPVLVVGSLENHMLDVFAGVLGAIVAAGWIVATRDDPTPICPTPDYRPELTDTEYVESYTED